MLNTLKVTFRCTRAHFISIKLVVNFLDNYLGFPKKYLYTL